MTPSIAINSFEGFVFVANEDEPDNIANNPIETLSDITHIQDELFIEWTCPNINSHFNCNQYILFALNMRTFLVSSSCNSTEFDYSNGGKKIKKNTKKKPSFILQSQKLNDIFFQISLKKNHYFFTIYNRELLKIVFKL